MITLPNRIFFTGVPGSRWSGIAQDLEDQIPGFNVSDRTPPRTYSHNVGGHKGAYFGPGMEFDAILDLDYLDRAHIEPGGTRLIKSHEWAYHLNSIKTMFPNDWIMLVYRPDMISYATWHEAGGFLHIDYPCYQSYDNSINMLTEIMNQNRNILAFAHEHRTQWSHFTPEWAEQTFGHRIQIRIPDSAADILVTVIR